MFAAIRAIEYHLPQRALPNETLVRDFPQWTAEKIESKTGIANRFLADSGELASDLAAAAAGKLFARGACQPGDIDYLLLCTQSPDYLIPTTACLLQQRLGLPTTVGALDFNLGCSGFIYGLSLAKGLVESGEARRVLLLTAETYSKHMDPADMNVRSIFGDGASATLIAASEPGSGSGQPWIGPLVYGTDGGGKDTLILRRGSLRDDPRPEVPVPPGGDSRSRHGLFMDGPAILSFTLKVVPDSVARLLDKAHLALDAVDVFVFHQANQFILEHLRRKLGIPAEKFVYALRDCGNTVSSTIPIALARAEREGVLAPGKLVMLVGFGVGSSWAAALIRWCGDQAGSIDA
jgi:3-oxoacyl-[acyl-carrier-protein] synthase III